MEINFKQLEEESGVKLKGISMKLDQITFEDLSKEDDIKVRETLKSHIPNPPEPQITLKDIMDKLNILEKR